MTHRENIVLYNVLNNEVIFEEYFCNLLQFDNFRNLFIKFINSKNELFSMGDVKYNHFDTEVTLSKDYGRADLFLKYNKEEYIFEIKNKCATSLTENQPKGYLKYLKNNNEQLFFLLPRFYRHKDEIINRWNKCSYFENIEDKIFYWEDFIKEIQKEQLYIQNIEIKMFYEFCLYWFNMRPIEFNDKELNMLNDTTLPQTMQKLFTIVDGVLNNNIEFLEKENKQNQDWYGYIINNDKYQIDENYEIWFGVDYSIWATKNYPLIIHICSDDEKKMEEISKLKLNGYDIEKYEYEYDNGDMIYYFSFNNNVLKLKGINLAEEFSNDIYSVIKMIQNIR